MFQQQFVAEFTELHLALENEEGQIEWQWNQFEKFIESPHFFHFYFNSKSFIIIPNDEMEDEMRHEIRGILKRNIQS
jgi:hypothetical protein